MEPFAESERFAIDFANYMLTDAYYWDNVEQKTHSIEEHLEYFKSFRMKIKELAKDQPF